MYQCVFFQTNPFVHVFIEFFQLQLPSQVDIRKWKFISVEPLQKIDLVKKFSSFGSTSSTKISMFYKNCCLCITICTFDGDFISLLRIGARNK